MLVGKWIVIIIYNMKFKEYLQEATSNKITIYHSSNVYIPNIDPKYMLHGNAQEGVGIYFSEDLQETKGYGDKTVKIEINKRNFKYSRDDTFKHCSMLSISQLLNELKNYDNDSMIILASDYGIDSNSLRQSHLIEISKQIGDTEIRNFQIELAQRFSVEQLVSAWNKVFPKIHGLYENSHWSIYSVINTNYKVERG